LRVSRAAASHTRSRSSNDGNAVDALDVGLCPRQLMASGYSHESIADRLAISRHTGNEHGRSIYNKLDVHSRTELVNKLLFAAAWVATRILLQLESTTAPNSRTAANLARRCRALRQVEP
jgi:DNA-binding CsgD family transcriptional regulator